MNTEAVGEALQVVLDEMELWAADPNAAYEQVAEQFYRETGFIAPGKSVPLAMSSVDYDEERRRRYAAWHLRRRELRHATVRDAIAALEAVAQQPCALQIQPVDGDGQ